jgi:hypothetical protein
VSGAGVPSPTDAQDDGPVVRVRSDVADVALGLVLMAGAAGFLIATRQLDGPDHTGIGSATFPTGIAMLFGVVSGVLMLRGLSGLAGPERVPPVVVGRPVALVISIGLVCVFPVMMAKLGYYVATALWLPAFLLAAGYRKPLGLLLYTGGFLAFAKLAFEMTLGVRLP